MIRDATEGDWPAVLELNTAFEHFLSPLDAPRLRGLAAASCYFRVLVSDGVIAGFLLAFRKGADYDGSIFRHFSERADDFVYIDRIVVSAAHRGQGVADLLYDDIASFAKTSDIATLLCEVNVIPPNDVSMRFHVRWGFREIGTLLLDNGKTVALLERNL